MASKQLGVWELPPQRLHSIVRSTSAVEPARNVVEHISFFCLIVAIPPHGPSGSSPLVDLLVRDAYFGLGTTRSR